MTSHTDALLAHWGNIPEAERTEALNGGWYRESRRTARQLARKHGVTLSQAAGVIAALSPRTRWAENVAGADRLMYQRNLPAILLELAPSVPGFGANIRKAERILDGERPLAVLGGDKVRAFYRAIMGDPEAIVIDVWMLRAAGLEVSYGRPVGQDVRTAQKVVGDALIAAARTVGVPVADFQALVWTYIRGGGE